MSSVMTSGEYSRAIASAEAPSEVTSTLKPLLVGDIEQEAGEAEIVLDDEQDMIAGADVLAIVADLVDERGDERFPRPRDRAA